MGTFSIKVWLGFTVSLVPMMALADTMRCPTGPELLEVCTISGPSSQGLSPGQCFGKPVQFTISSLSAPSYGFLQATWNWQYPKRLACKYTEHASGGPIGLFWDDTSASFIALLQDTSWISANGARTAYVCPQGVDPTKCALEN